MIKQVNNRQMQNINVTSPHISPTFIHTLAPHTIDELQSLLLFQ
jgi:hypothetical protein